MSKSVLFVQHDHVSPPSLLGAAFEQRGFDVEMFQVVPAERSHHPGVEVVFPDPAQYDVIVPMGARWSSYDLPLIGSWVEPETAMLLAADRAGVPVLGVCFGGQLLAQAHGGTVAASDRPELGWRSVESDEDFLAAGPWFQWHYDRWSLPAGAREIARNPAASQAFVIRRSLALQFHPELTTDMLQGWLANGGDHQLQALARS